VTYPVPTAQRLLERLKQLGAVDEHVDKLDSAEARDAINQFLCDQAVCSRAVIDGKERVLRFSEYHAAVYGEKWKYVPHSERGLLAELPK
jgi:hypothetical protein